jgi:hypothetical protein
MGMLVGLLEFGEAKVGTIVLVVFVLGFWAYRVWMNKRDFTALRRAAVEGTDERRSANVPCTSRRR